MFGWYVREIVDPGRQPMFLALLAFVLTFLTTRAITRLIRSGRGPFKNVETGGVHIHHVVPGIICTLAGGLLALGASEAGPWKSIAGILFGIGAALVLDEFAMILHLNDVYWESEGKLSADAIMLASVVGFSALLIAAPNQPPVDEETGWVWTTVGVVSFIVFWLLPEAITILKGKVWIAAFALAFLPLAWFGAIRLAKINSVWAHYRYADPSAKRTRAEARTQRSRRRWDPVRHLLQDKIFGLAKDSETSKQLGD